MSQDTADTGARRTLRIGKYEVIGHIATGGMGAVYKARDVDLNREVALKVLSPEMAAKPNMIERFRREAKSAAKLRHDNIVSIYDFGEYKGTYYLALEFVHGVDLHQYVVDKGKLDSEEARQILIQAAQALKHAHTQRIVHRDIKPSNFLISNAEGKLQVKLTDLGLAREVREDEYRVTRMGTTIGTVDYMAPEQARDSSAADARSDIYSLGCTFFHMLAGVSPFPKGSLAERIMHHLETPPPDIRKLNPNVPQRLASILEKMLAKKPADRYQSPEDLLADLEGKGPIANTTANLDSLQALRELAAEDRRRAADPTRALKTSVAIQADGPRSASSGRRVAAPSASPRKLARRDDEEEAQPQRRLLPSWWPLIVVGIGILIAGIIVMGQLRKIEEEPGAKAPPGIKK